MELRFAGGDGSQTVNFKIWKKETAKNQPTHTHKKNSWKKKRAMDKNDR